MKKILLATPMMPPTPGGPSTHAKKLVEHFGFKLFNFEKYKKFPSGLRHLLAFFEIFFKSINKDIIFALDGFTVALPSVLVGKILRKKVILRIGGDFIYENFLYTKEINYQEFYEKFEENKKLMKKNSYKLYLKYLIQKFVTKNCSAIIFNTNWQKNIFEKHYILQNKKLFIIENPIQEISENTFENLNLEKDFPEFQKNLNEKKFIFTSITRDIPYKNLKRLKQVFNVLGEEYYLETKQGSHESCLKRISLSRAYICASISDIAPNQVLEALSLKVPIILSKYTGYSEILEKAGVAILIDPQNEEEIQNAILEMCEDEKYFIYKNNLEKFTWPQTWENLFLEYKKISDEIKLIYQM